MSKITGPVGIVGGTGQLGGAIARALLTAGAIAPHAIWLSGRSGNARNFESWPWINVTTDHQALIDACPVIVLSLPPAAMAGFRVKARDKLVISVMAGITANQIREATGASRVVRAMSSPVAEFGLAYSPWHALPDVTDADRQQVTAIFAPCGLSDEVGDEDQIDRFTALTGPVPGFVANFAAAMIEHSVKVGIDPAIAERAVRQLFKGAGEMLATSEKSPAQQVEDMLAYAGTTAAGLKAMNASPLKSAIASGLDASYQRTKTIADG